MRKADEKLLHAGERTAVEAEKAFEYMETTIKTPWMKQANKRLRHAPDHWNKKFIKLLARKKLLYERMKW